MYSIASRTLFRNSCVQNLCGTKLKLYFHFFYTALSPEFGDYFTKNLDVSHHIFEKLQTKWNILNVQGEKYIAKRDWMKIGNENATTTIRQGRREGKNTSHYSIDRFV